MQNPLFIYERGISLNTNAKWSSVLNNQIHRSTKTGSTSSNFYGIYTSGSIGGSEISGNHIYKLRSSGAYSGTVQGISLNSTGGLLAQPVIISDNLIDSILHSGTFYGIYSSSSNYSSVSGNVISGISGSTTFNGVYLASSYFSPVSGNLLYDISVSTFNGIYLNSSSGSLAQPVLVSNNAVSNIKATGIFSGLYMSSSLHFQLYHNSIDIGNNMTGSSVNYGIRIEGGSCCTSGLFEVKNNNISITGGSASGTKYGFYYGNGSYLSLADSGAQGNNIYINTTQGGAKYYGYYNSTNYTTMASFKAAYHSLETTSPSADPMFVDAANGDLTPQNSQLLGQGVVLNSIVPLDINGGFRPTPPSIGAFEAQPHNDAGVYAFYTATPNACVGTKMMNVVIINNGANDINNLDIYWEKDNVLQPVIHYNQTIVPFGSPGKNKDTVELGLVTFEYGVPLALKAWTSLPNGFNDPIVLNDTLKKLFTATAYLPTANGIIVTTTNSLNFTFAIDNPQHATEYIWDFGDGSAPFTTTDNYDWTHPYVIAEDYQVTVILRNDCGEIVLNSTIFHSLPVEMSPLTGVLNERNQAVLSWETFMERNNQGFEIHRSEDGKTFRQIGYQISLSEDGNSHDPIDYSFTDSERIIDRSFYRIVQIDIDGKSTVSNIIQLSVTQRSGLSMIVFPNPTEGKVTVSLTGELSENSNLSILDVMGRLIKEVKVDSKELDIDLSDLNSGMYMIQYSDENGKAVMRVSKL